MLESQPLRLAKRSVEALSFGRFIVPRPPDLVVGLTKVLTKIFKNVFTTALSHPVLSLIVILVIAFVIWLNEPAIRANAMGTVGFEVAYHAYMYMVSTYSNTPTWATLLAVGILLLIVSVEPNHQTQVGTPA